MGTNYYAIKKKDREYMRKKREIINLLKENNLEGASEKLEELNQVYAIGIHLGKKSYGWRFLFDHNDEKYYESNKTSIKEFLRKGYIIRDEYGRLVSKREFWKMVTLSMKDKKNIGNMEYDMEYPEYAYPYSYPPDKIAQKYNVSHCEYYNDGLRFSDRTDFS